MGTEDNYKERLCAKAEELQALGMHVQADELRRITHQMESRERELSAEISQLRVALRFYANGDHLVLDETEEFDTVSGEPQNWLCSGMENSSTMVENGGVARLALQGVQATWVDGDEDTTPEPVEGEVSCVR